MNVCVAFSEIVGKTFSEVIGEVGGDEILFKTADGIVYKLYHDQDCCEHVRVEDINGDLDDLVGPPIIWAEESTNSDNPPEDVDDSFLWTFYKIQTAKGHVVIRWLGESNGWYSESVDFIKYAMPAEGMGEGA